MSDEERLREAVARLCGVEPGQVGPDFALGAHLKDSLSGHRFDAVVRRQFPNAVRVPRQIETFGELCAAVLGGPASPATPSAMPARNTLPAGSGPRCGIDLERVAGLPETNDYFQHEFYRATFSEAEIAYCVLQANPRVHFAARWCAKEALLKSSLDYGQVKPTDVEVFVDEAGAPRLRWTADQDPLACVLSLSHTDEYALAIVVWGAPVPKGVFGSTQPLSTRESPLTILSLLIALLALLVALLR